MRYVIVVLLLAFQAGAAPHHEPPPRQVLAPGYSELKFDAPEAGSYALPVLGHAADGHVIDETGAPHRLSELLGDKIVLLSFIYTNCDDVNGCPLASFVLSRVQDRIVDSGVEGEVRLVSLSFDRANDDVETLRKYAENFRNPDFDWRFLTTPSDAALSQVLEAYNQFIIVDRNEEGEPVGSISHVLRVYLIDMDGAFRNIYSVSFLHPDIIIGDIKTILMEREGQ